MSYRFQVFRQKSPNFEVLGRAAALVSRESGDVTSLPDKPITRADAVIFARDGKRDIGLFSFKCHGKNNVSVVSLLVDSEYQDKGVRNLLYKAASRELSQHPLRYRFNVFKRPKFTRG